MKEEGLFKDDFEGAERIGYPIASFINSTHTPLERKELDTWILQSEKNEQLFNELTNEENIKKRCSGMPPLTEERPWNG